MKRYLCAAMAALLMLMSAPLAAQSTELPDVGVGAPRTSLIYIIARPKMLMALAGHDGKEYVWEKELQKQLGGDMPEDMPEEARRGSPSQLVKAAMESVLPLLENSTRIDIALTDVSTGGPLMYLDITLAQDAKVELTPDWVKQLAEQSEGEFTHSPVTIAGLKGVRYNAGRRGQMTIIAFEHKGHLYLCSADSVAQELADGLMNGSKEGESLQELERFRSWYFNRKGSGFEMWINAHEFRRWLQRIDGGLPEEIMAAYDEVDKLIELRTWQQFVIGLDYDTRYGVISHDVSIETRRPLPLFEKAQLKAASFGPIGKYVPESAVGVTGVQLGDVNGMIGRLRADLDRVLEKFIEMDGGRERSAEAVPAVPDDDGRFRTPQGMEEEKQGPFSQMLAELDSQLAEVGLSRTELLGAMTGGALAGVVKPANADEGYRFGQDTPMLFVLGLKDREVMIKALENVMASAKEQGSDRLVAIDTENGRLFYETAHCTSALLVTEDALLIAQLNSWPEDENDKTCINLIDSMVNAAKTDKQMQGVVGDLLKGTSTFFFGADLYSIIKGAEDIDRSESARLDRYSRPNFAKPAASFLDPGMALTGVVTITERRIDFNVKLHKTWVPKLIDMAIASSKRHDPRMEYAQQQLGTLYAHMQNSYVMGNQPLPSTFAAMLAEGTIHKTMLQSPFDPQFENSASLQWFPGAGAMEPEMDDIPDARIVRAAAEKGFVSYTLVDKPDLKAHGKWLIAAYETDANTAGGRLVLYSNGNVGWLHASVWEQALKLAAAGKEIPSRYSWESEPSEAEDMPPFPGDDD